MARKQGSCGAPDFARWAVGPGFECRRYTDPPHEQPHHPSHFRLQRKRLQGGGRAFLRAFLSALCLLPLPGFILICQRPLKPFRARIFAWIRCQFVNRICRDGNKYCMQNASSDISILSTFPFRSKLRTTSDQLLAEIYGRQFNSGCSDIPGASSPWSYGIQLKKQLVAGSSPAFAPTFALMCT